MYIYTYIYMCIYTYIYVYISGYADQMKVSGIHQIYIDNIYYMFIIFIRYRITETLI